MAPVAVSARFKDFLLHVDTSRIRWSPPPYDPAPSRIAFLTVLGVFLFFGLCFVAVATWIRCVEGQRVPRRHRRRNMHGHPKRGGGRLGGFQEWYRRRRAHSPPKHWRPLHVTDTKSWKSKPNGGSNGSSNNGAGEVNSGECAPLLPPQHHGHIGQLYSTFGNGNGNGGGGGGDASPLHHYQHQPQHLHQHLRTPPPAPRYPDRREHLNRTWTVPSASKAFRNGGGGGSSGNGIFKNGRDNGKHGKHVRNFARTARRKASTGTSPGTSTSTSVADSSSRSSSNSSNANMTEPAAPTLIRSWSAGNLCSGFDYDHRSLDVVLEEAGTTPER